MHQQIVQFSCRRQLRRMHPTFSHRQTNVIWDILLPHRWGCVPNDDETSCYIFLIFLIFLYQNIKMGFLSCAPFGSYKSKNMMVSNLDKHNWFYHLSNPYHSLVAREGEKSQEDSSKIRSIENILGAPMWILRCFILVHRFSCKSKLGKF